MMMIVVTAWKMSSDVVLDLVTLPRGTARQFLLPRSRLVLYTFAPRICLDMKTFDFDNFFEALLLEF